MINVTKTWLPSLEDYQKILGEIWDSGWVTSNGKLNQKLRQQLCDFFDTTYLQLVSSGTIGLEVAMHALDLSGEIITTPFSFVATTSAIKWIGLEPVFVDIDPNTFNIDPNKIEAVITPRTSAILATHIFGNPCQIEKIQAIADKHQLKVIYDAAPSFGVLYKNQPLISFGDIAVLSTHATKVFHTAEGGIVVSKNEAINNKISYSINFGLKGGDRGFHGLGINGKMSELHAAIGLCVFPKVKELIEKRKTLTEKYDSFLRKETTFNHQKIHPDCQYNYAYYPLVFQNEKTLIKIKNILNEHQIFPRRYFYPSLTNLNYIQKQQMPVAEDLATKILCLPLGYDLKLEQVAFISKLILNNI